MCVWGGIVGEEHFLQYFTTIQQPNTAQQRDTFQRAVYFLPAALYLPSLKFQCLLECLFFLLYHFSQNHRATVARFSRGCRTTFERRQNVSQISLEVVADSSHPSEILALRLLIATLTIAWCG